MSGSHTRRIRLGVSSDRNTWRCSTGQVAIRTEVVQDTLQGNRLFSFDVAAEILALLERSGRCNSTSDGVGNEDALQQHGGKYRVQRAGLNFLIALGFNSRTSSFYNSCDDKDRPLRTSRPTIRRPKQA